MLVVTSAEQTNRGATSVTCGKAASKVCTKLYSLRSGKRGCSDKAQTSAADEQKACASVTQRGDWGACGEAGDEAGLQTNRSPVDRLLRPDRDSRGFVLIVNFLNDVTGRTLYLNGPVLLLR